MAEFTLDVEQLGKRYRVPVSHHDSGFKKRASRHMKEFFGGLGGLSDQDYFWALKDISFQVKPGDTLGIVGKNGSGKSTLLKIISGVTEPTKGRARIRGVVGSLLEVGTGFHPDMTGRENIFMSGALLGMKRADIRHKFDEIVFFSGVEDFLDVPVKRYSSGMYVRLAYAVASHLDTEILILDEVLAVGDAEFQQKSRTNISQAASDGKTILFVSHNPLAVMKICKQGMVLDQGRSVFQGDAKDAISDYMRRTTGIVEGQRIAQNSTTIDLKSVPRLQKIAKNIISSFSITTVDGYHCSSFNTGEDAKFIVEYEGLPAQVPYLSILFSNMAGIRVLTINSTHSEPPIEMSTSGTVECVIPSLPLGDGEYSIMLDIGHYGGSNDNVVSMDCIPNAAKIRINWNSFKPGLSFDQYHGPTHSSHWERLT